MLRSPGFGGKSRVAPAVWERFGCVRNYVEPFAGSLATLLARPHDPGVETVNDIDCYIVNFWRALQHAPEEVAHWADSPVNEADLHARHRCRQDQGAQREEGEGVMTVADWIILGGCVFFLAGMAWAYWPPWGHGDQS